MRERRTKGGEMEGGKVGRLGRLGRKGGREKMREGGSVGDDDEEERGREKTGKEGSLGGRERVKREGEF